jgi:transcriptional antiterminator RfaH
MPLLPLEPYVYPDDILSSPPNDDDGSSQWWVLHTRPRAEKCLARRFLDRGLSFFLPLHKREWRNQGRRFCSHVPLFPGYIFLYGNHEARWDAVKTNLIANVLPVGDADELRADLSRVYQLMLSEAALTPEERVPLGTPVEIISGPLAGLQGKVAGHGKQLRFLVEVRFLQRGVSVEIERWMFEPLHQARPLMAAR